jgi:hypothetical protein
MENKETIELMHKIFVSESQTKENLKDYIECLNELKYLANKILSNFSFDDEINDYIELMYDFNQEINLAIEFEDYEYAAKLRDLIVFEELCMNKYIKEHLNETQEVAFYIIEETKNKIKQELL